MRRISTTTKHRSGFTLVEVLVVSPIALLAIGTLVVAIVVMTGDTIRAQVQAQIQYDVLNALDRIEEDVERAATVNETSGPEIDLDSFATDNDPAEPNRQIYSRTTCQVEPSGVDRSDALVYSTYYRMPGDRLQRQVALDHGCDNAWVMSWQKMGTSTLIDARGGTITLDLVYKSATKVQVTLQEKRTVAGEDVMYSATRTMTIRNQQ